VELRFVTVFQWKRGWCFRSIWYKTIMRRSAFVINGVIIKCSFVDRYRLLGYIYIYIYIYIYNCILLSVYVFVCMSCFHVISLCAIFAQNKCFLTQYTWYTTWNCAVFVQCLNIDFSTRCRNTENPFLRLIAPPKLFYNWV